MTMRPVSEWPLVLCGPMVRRVTASQVSVFVATKEPCEVTLRVDSDRTGSGTPAGSISGRTTAFGERLHIAVVTLNAALSAGRVYGYDLSFKVEGSSTSRSLADLGLLSGEGALGFAEGKLPSFVLPQGLDKLKVAHSSCRKPHGGGHDALTFLGDLLEGTVDDPVKRPQQLLLTGDQVYSDDVASALLATLSETSEALMGAVAAETVPNHDASRQLPMSDPLLAPGMRVRYVKDEADYSSNESHNHLVSLGEFYAMYLMAWSDALWPRGEGGVLRLSDSAPQWNYKKDRAGDPDEECGIEALSYGATVYKVRRTLANIATYMMFDDHEITDDWYLNGRWNARVRANPAGRRMVRNGLAAYALFQDWGNQPEQYESGHPGDDETGHGDSIIGCLALQGDTGKPHAWSDYGDSVLCSLLDCGEDRVEAAHRKHWSYRVDFDEHRIVSLDSRTWRAYAGDHDVAGAELLSASALDRQLPRPAAGDDKLTLLLSPAPVFGVPMIEEAVQKLGVMLKGSEKFDNEPWGANRVAFERLLERLDDYRKVVILSGDVHYAFSCDVAYFGKMPRSVSPSRFVQLCASAAKNSDFMTHTMGYIGYFRGTELHDFWKYRGWKGFDRSFEEHAEAFKRILYEQLPEESGWDEKMARQLYVMMMINDRLAAPAVIPAGPWYEDEALALARGFDEAVYTDASWSYGIRYLSDERTIHDRVAPSPYGIAKGLNQSYDDPSIQEASERQVAELGDLFREVVGGNSFGLVTFELGGSGHGRERLTKAVHELHWTTHSATEVPRMEQAMITRHEADLTTPGDDEYPEFEK